MIKNMSSYTYIPNSTTEVYYPKSKKVKIDSKGNVISDSSKTRKNKQVTPVCEIGVNPNGHFLVSVCIGVTTCW